MSNRKLLADAVRALSMDAVQAANSGHPGMPMGMADIAEVLWNDFLKHNPADPDWHDRDRVVVSNGHGSMLPYSVLHLTGYDLPVEQLRNFRQLHAMTPGHPEYGEAPGIETTTGPLGQGIANAVGMAMAEKVLANRYNSGDHKLVDHYTYVLLGDGCLMEGISHEVCSLAGTHKLGKLICLYDDNNISIDGEVEGWFTDDTAARFESYGWQVIRNIDGHDPDSIHTAISDARRQTERPTLICCKTVIGYGSPNKQGTASTHGAPLGDEEIAATRERLGWSHEPFVIPDEVYAGWDAKDAGKVKQAEWQSRLDAWRQAEPELAAEYDRRMAGDLPANWAESSAAIIQQLQQDGASVASRKASQMALDAFGPLLPELIGGSADLAGSNNTIWSGSQDILENDRDGNYIYFGVREFGMTAICNGIALHGGLIPYSATFLVFSDYARNAVRMSSLLPVRNIHVYTHDSIGLGEDGPTHQPVEHLGSLRLIPGLDVWRPCDTVESAVAWQQAIEANTPSALVFTRQGIPHQSRDTAQLANVSRGGYVLRKEKGDSLDLILIATGSEVSLAMEAAEKLESEGKAVRVVSMPCTDRFDAQDAGYRDSVLPPSVRARVAVEAASADYWARYTGLDGAVVGMRSFGASAPAAELYREFGITVDTVIEAARAVSG